MTEQDRMARRRIHFGWWVVVTVVAVSSVALGRPVEIAGADWHHMFNVIVGIAALSLIPAIRYRGRWVDAYIILTGFHFCVRLAALIFDQSDDPLSLKGRALAAVLYSGYIVSLLATRFTYQLMEGRE